MGSSAASDRFTLALTLPLPYEQAVLAVREALSDQGFGILTEIDLASTMKEKLGEEIAPQVILGACRPPLAHRALLADPSVATMLPCNVVVRALDATTSQVEAFDPDVMTSFSTGEAIAEVAADAKRRLTAALTALESAHPASEQGS